MSHIEDMAEPNLELAIEFAVQAHRSQYRDGDHPLPYITHPLDVLANLRYTGQVTDPSILCAAILHDVVEESGIEFDEIRARFGDRVAELVEELTRKEPTTAEKVGMTKDEIWELRSKMLLEEIAQMSPTAQSIKLADRLSNLFEATRVKNAKKLVRYNSQTKEILKIIPKKVNPDLWQAVSDLQAKVAKSL